MIILGISALDKDSAATLVKDGKIIYALQEERLTRNKHQGGFPHKAIQLILDRTSLSPKDIDTVAYPFYPWWHETFLILLEYLKNNIANLFYKSSLYEKWWHFLSYSRWVVTSIKDHFRYHYELTSELKKLGILHKLQRVDHHLAHCAAAYATSGFKDSLVVSIDWYGSGLAGTICLGQNGHLKRIFKLKYPHSPGLFYAQVTLNLGFKISSHEGKIVGLAAFGDSEVLAPLVRKKFFNKKGGIRYISAMNFRFSKHLAQKYRREDVAAAYQKVVEEVASKWIHYYLQKYQMDCVALAGGVAANVKLNQRIYEIEGVKKIYVYPSMGDQGTGSGAAFYLLLKNGLKPFPLHDVYFGPDYSNDEIEVALNKKGLHWERPKEIEKEVGKLLAANKVVAVFHGRMEYGPRALGNRSILYPATDPRVNDWLNKQLGRSEFMPFAPAVLPQYATQCFENYNKADLSADFMTVTFNCTEYMKKTGPAAVHVDGTARPQIVRPHKNRSFYKTLQSYYQLTGIPLIVNTSFNMHEEPIVCTPDDAIRAFLLGHLDYLAMGPYLIKKTPINNEQ